MGILSKFCVVLAAVAISGLVAYPFDTVRRSLMIQACKSLVSLHSCAVSSTRFTTDTTDHFGGF